MSNASPVLPACTDDIHGDPKGIRLGRILFGHNAQKSLYIPVSDISKHLLCVGSTGSGKTTALKGVAESLICRGTPVVAIDVTGDLLGLLVPAGSPAVYDQIGVPPPDIGAGDWEMGALAADWLARHVHPRFITPCSDLGERLSITPLMPRPQAYERLKREADENGDTDLDIQADAIAVNLLGKMGVRMRGIENGPSVTRSALTEAVKAAWEEDVDLQGVEGLRNFRSVMDVVTSPAVPESIKTAMDNLIAASSGGLEKQWYQGKALDFDELLTAPAGRTPVIVISVAHLMATQPDAVPFVVCQVLHQVMNYVVGKGNGAPGKLRMAVILDELCGDRNFPILPPGNRRSPSGNAVHRALRVSRHYATTVFGGTQNAGDIDYKSYSNFNLRFVGRQATSSDASRSIYGVDIDEDRASYLKQQIARASPGHLYVIRPNGQWEPVAFRWIGSFHSKIPKAQMRRLYELGFLTERHGDRMERSAPSAITKPRQISELMSVLTRFRDRLPDELVAELGL